MTGRARARARGRARGGVTEKDDRRPGGPPESKQEVCSVVGVVMILHAYECSFIHPTIHPSNSVCSCLEVSSLRPSSLFPLQHSPHRMAVLRKVFLGDMW